MSTILLIRCRLIYQTANTIVCFNYPNLGALPQTTRERPPGCRTVFVGGLPENCNEEFLREAFDNCGIMTSVRYSKKNFAHIRFEEEESVDKALFLSGKVI